MSFIDFIHYLLPYFSFHSLLPFRSLLSVILIFIIIIIICHQYLPSMMRPFFLATILYHDELY
jgi:type III secretory pathway component EscU